MAGGVDVLCAGIVVADHICTPLPRVPDAGELILADAMQVLVGGCAANAAVDLAKMNASAAVLGRVGDDGFGRIITDLLRAAQIDSSGLCVSAGHATSQTMIVNVRGQDRRFIHTFGANAAFAAADIPLDRVRQARMLYVGGYLLLPGLLQGDLARVFQAARAAGVRVVLDVAIPGRGEYRARLEQLLQHVDVFLPNNDEAEMILEIADPVRQAEAFHRMGAGTAVVTLGSRGAVLINDTVRLRAGVYPIEFVDGSGSGDAFDAGFIYGMLHDLDPAGCLRVASALGASCVRALGTTPGVFREQECLEFIRRHPLALEAI